MPAPDRRGNDDAGSSSDGPADDRIVVRHAAFTEPTHDEIEPVVAVAMTVAHESAVTRQRIDSLERRSSAERVPAAGEVGRG